MYVFLFVFCCFKQKTAYEMRISDWSSDVCSSDLVWSLLSKLTLCTSYGRPVSSSMIDAFTPLGVGSEYSWMRSGCCAGHFRVIENADKSGFMSAPKSGISVYRNGLSAGHVPVLSSRHCEEAEGR